MALPLYLAMTAAEIQGNSDFPVLLAYMACHFSPYGSGLCNLPDSLPAGSMLILNDRIPCRRHDHRLITEQLTQLLEALECGSLLLDFQQPGSAEAAALTKTLLDSLPCPIAVSKDYAEELDCPIFLPPVPPDVSLANYLAPWKGREIWLDVGMDGLNLTLTETGCESASLPWPNLSGGHADKILHTHYLISQTGNCVQFQLFRTKEDFHALLAEAETLGVHQAVGLWQELCSE